MKRRAGVPPRRRRSVAGRSGSRPSGLKGTASQRSRPRTGHGSAGAASRWRAPAGRWAARRLVPAPRGGGTRVRTAEAPVPPPSAPQGAQRWVALLALQPGTACAVLRGAPVSECGPPPTPRRRRPRLQPQTPRGLRWLRAGTALPLPPRGRPGSTHPSPARRNESLAARRAPSVKAKPYGWRAKGTRASLDSARPAAGLVAAAWPENGLGLRASRTGGAPAGRGVAPCTRVPLRT
jgi:hypothetical protein